MDKNLLLSQDSLKVQEVKLEGFGVVKVKGLNTLEVQESTNEDMDENEMSWHIVSKALVDPEMTPEEVSQWKAVAPAWQFIKVYNKVAELSGLDVASAKKAYKSTGNRRKR